MHFLYQTERTFEIPPATSLAARFIRHLFRIQVDWTPLGLESIIILIKTFLCLEGIIGYRQTLITGYPPTRLNFKPWRKTRTRLRWVQRRFSGRALSMSSETTAA